MRRRLRQSARFWACIALLLAAAGCGRNESLPFTSETDEPNFRRGQQLVKTDRSQEAMAAFLKVIEKRGEDAPESHLEVGLIYQQNIKDPLAAIYHFRKYLELKPNSPQADLVRQRIDAATRDFARTLPAQPIENSMDRLDMMELVSRLQRENNALKEENAALRSAVPGNTTIAAAAPISRSMDLEGREPTITIHTSRPPVASTAQSGTARPPSGKPAASAAGGGRRHTIVKGDTLSQISAKYYGDRSHINQIYEANKDVMKSPNDLKLGVELKIP